MADGSSTASFKSVRSIATIVLLGVKSGGSLTRLLAENSPKVSPKDQPLLAEITYGSCRWYHRLDAVLSVLMKKPLRNRDADIHALMIIGLYQLVHMRIKPHAVLTETVNAARHLRKPMFTKLVNGVLRSFQRDSQKILSQVDSQDTSRYSQPNWLLDEIKSDWPDHWENIAAALLKQPPFTLRVNQKKTDTNTYLQRLVSEGLQASPVDGINSALVLDRAVAVEQVPDFFQGYVSVQDAGAQLAAMLLNVKAGGKVLDACSAPGGKTGHILEQADTVSLTAIDVDATRLDKVKDNLQRLNLQATLEVADAAETNGPWSEQTYDYILLDVPCSATGVIRRHPDIKLLRRKNDLSGLVRQQRAILQNVWPLLKQGGHLLYVTCSLLSCENELQVDWFLKQQQDAEELSLNPQVVHHKRIHGIQVIPGDFNNDGFFYSLMTKRSIQ